MAELPTVKIYLPHDSGDHAIINESDFDESKHVRYEDRDKPADEGEPKAKRGKKAEASAETV